MLLMEPACFSILPKKAMICRYKDPKFGYYNQLEKLKKINIFESLTF